MQSGNGLNCECTETNDSADSPDGILSICGGHGGYTMPEKPKIIVVNEEDMSPRIKSIYVTFRKKDEIPEYDEQRAEIRATVHILESSNKNEVKVRFWFEHPTIHHPVCDVLKCLNWIEDDLDWGSQCRYEKLIYAIDSWLGSERLSQILDCKKNDIIEV
jgi:hypothetical protein